MQHVLGLTTFPLFSVAAAHAHDFANADERVEHSAALMFLFALGAIATYTASELIEAYGLSSLFLLIWARHDTLLIYGLYLLGVRSTVKEKNTLPLRTAGQFHNGALVKTAERRKIIFSDHLI